MQIVHISWNTSPGAHEHDACNSNNVNCNSGAGKSLRHVRHECAEEYHNTQLLAPVYSLAQIGKGEGGWGHAIFHHQYCTATTYPGYTQPHASCVLLLDESLSTVSKNKHN
jgi:hypothetical protein